MSELPSSLRATAADNLAEGLRAATSLIDVVAPGWGSIFGSLIGQVIPDLREKRVLQYLTRLGSELKEMQTRVDQIDWKSHPESVALFEDAALIAARSTSQTRIDRIASVVAGHITREEKLVSQARSLLKLSAELTDPEAALLVTWCGLGGTRVYSAGMTDPDDQPFYAIWMHRLMSLGLLEYSGGYMWPDNERKQQVQKGVHPTSLGRQVCKLFS